MLRAIRFNQFQNYKNHSPLGLTGDLENMQTAITLTLNYTLSNLDRDIKESEDRMSEEIEYVDENGEEQLYSIVDYFDYYSNIGAKTLIINSSIFSIYSFFETSLLRFCKLLDPNISFDRKGSYVDKYKTYLSQTHGIDFAPIEDTWEMIKSYQLFRNELMHSAVVELKNRKDLKKIRRLGHLEEIKHPNSSFISFRISSDKIVIDFLLIIVNFLEFIYYKELVK